MRKALIAGVLPLLVSAYAYAGCVGNIVNGECLGTYFDDPNIGTRAPANNSGYQGMSGARYQYDTSRPSDSIRYSTDLDAQRRDQMAIDPRRDLDRSRGVNGGGILPSR